MAEHVGAGAAPTSAPLMSARPTTVSRSGARRRATGAPSTHPAAKKSSAIKVGAPIVSSDIALVDDLDRRQIGLDGARDVVRGERRVGAIRSCASLTAISHSTPTRTKSPARNDTPLS